MMPLQALFVAHSGIKILTLHEMCRENFNFFCNSNLYIKASSFALGTEFWPF